MFLTLRSTERFASSATCSAELRCRTLTVSVCKNVSSNFEGGSSKEESRCVFPLNVD